MKKYFLISLLLMTVPFFSGCSILNTSSSDSTGGVLKSDDSGTNWVFKNKVNEKKTIAGIDILQMKIDPIDTNRIYLGTKKKGIVFSVNEAETWEKMKFPGNDVYGIAINRFRPGTVYAAGVYKKRGKVFRTDDYGKTWNEIYTEPANGTKITALTISENNPKILFLGTSSGDVLKTVDGGSTWKKVYTAKGIVSQILIGDLSDNVVYGVVYKKNLIVSADGGNTFDIVGRDAKNLTNKDLKNAVFYSMTVGNYFERGNENPAIFTEKERQRFVAGKILYIGTNKGLFRSYDYGKTFERVNILSDSKKYPIRAIAVNPKNSQEIIYGAAQAIYKSSDNGKHWSTFQIDTKKVVANIRYVPDNVSAVFAGLRTFSSKNIK